MSRNESSYNLNIFKYKLLLLKSIYIPFSINKSQKISPDTLKETTTK